MAFSLHLRNLLPFSGEFIRNTFSRLFLTKRFEKNILYLQLLRAFDSPQVPLSSPLGTAWWASCDAWGGYLPESVTMVMTLFSSFPPQDLPDDLRERWETFCTSSLGETNKRNTVDLVGFTRLNFYGFRPLRLCSFIQKDAKDLPFVPAIV